MTTIPQLKCDILDCDDYAIEFELDGERISMPGPIGGIINCNHPESFRKYCHKHSFYLEVSWHKKNV